VTLSRRVLLGTVAAATVLPASHSWAQQEPIRIGVLNDQSGLNRDFGGPTSVLAARMAVEDFGGNVFGRPIEVIDADHQNKADLASAIARGGVVPTIGEPDHLRFGSLRLQQEAREIGGGEPTPSSRQRSSASPAGARSSRDW
jgi:hypothetical protein